MDVLKILRISSLTILREFCKMGIFLEIMYIFFFLKLTPIHVFCITDIKGPNMTGQQELA